MTGTDASDETSGRRGPRRLGYGRATPRDPRGVRQNAMLSAAGLDDDAIFFEPPLGPHAARPVWSDCRRLLRPGDLLLIAGIDALGRDLREVLATIAELRDRRIGIHDLVAAIDSRTPVGAAVWDMTASLVAVEQTLRTDRARGDATFRPRRGRRPMVSDTQVRTAMARIAAGEAGEAVAGEYGVSRQALYKRARRLAADTAAPGSGS